MKKFKVLLVSSAQPSANPRLIKEAISLCNNGYLVTVVWTPISPWADQFDSELFQLYSDIKWVKAGYHYKSQKILYTYARFRKQVWRLIYSLFGNILNAAVKSENLFFQELKKKAISFKSDLYIGHNIGALPVIVKAAKMYKSKSIFDFEDFYRGESKSDIIQQKKIIDIEGSYIQCVNVLTASSSLISDNYRKIFKNKPIKTIYNVFPKKYAVDKCNSIPIEPLRLFWFSQYVGKCRGIESIIRAMSSLPPKSVTLTLLGQASDDIKKYFYTLINKDSLSANQIIFLDPVSEKDITAIASNHHIGIASEIAYIPNRDLCLTNKIFMYMLSGNAIVMSDTLAQKKFWQDNSQIGSCFEQEDPKSLAKVLNHYLKNPDILLAHRENSLELSKSKFNWDNQQVEMLEIIETLLDY